MTAEWQDSRIDKHVRFIFGSILVLTWTILVIARREVMLMEPDLWWHIKTGAWMWTHGTVPRVDPFSYTFAGTPWIAKEWLSQIVYFAAFSLAGWNGVMLLAIAAVGLGAGVLFWVLSRELHPIYAAVASILALVLASPSFTVRPHLLTLVLFIIWTYGLFTAARRAEGPPFIFLPMLVLWANLHAAFTIGFVIAFFAFLDFIERTRLAQRDAMMKWLIFLVLCPLVTLLHPYLWQPMLLTWNIVGPNEAVPMISEWKPFNTQSDIVLHVALLVMIFMSIATGFRLGIAKSLLAVLLLHLFFTHLRYGYFLFPVLAILAAPEIAQQFPRLSAAQWRRQPRDPVERAASRFVRPMTAVIAGAIILLAVLQAFVLRTAPNEEVAITAAIAYAKANGITQNVMNHYNFGGPLIFHSIPTFIDGRAEQQLFMDGFAKQFVFGPDKPDKLAKSLNDYKVGWTLFPPEDRRVAMLDKLAGWRRVYSDPYAVIHLRGETE